MKRVIGVSVIFLLTMSAVTAGFVPRVVIQSPPQAEVFIYPPVCESMQLPTIPNYGVIYAQVYTHDADVLYIEFNGQPITDEFGNIIYYPKFDPERLEIIPIYILVQDKPSYIMARAENENGSNTVYSVFIPIPTGRGSLRPSYGCTTMY